MGITHEASFKAVDPCGLEQILVRFSSLIIEQKWIKEIDINPLFASADRLVALDARVVVHGPEIPEEKIPKSAIRPYPASRLQTLRSTASIPVPRCPAAHALCSQAASRTGPRLVTAE